ncbi:kinetochore-associated protein DSN1 homolog [Aythya fuligula]|uniref:Kinetochore-associated protein DSN1 homolog n=1 Tax=Aythya fuligula TaxID=219594 RepID=A0A6J3EB15_AYTFU|nr:kinetochore-associated protein DSN1 homolog [Aythya fuligula]
MLARTAEPAQCRSEEMPQETSPGAAQTTPCAADGAVSEPDSGEKKGDAEQPVKAPDVTAVSKNVSSLVNAGAGTRKSCRGSPSPRKSPLLVTPQAKRRSWRRSSLKGTKRRKSLPPFHQDVTELCQSISLDLPETDRLSELLLSSFQFSAQKLENVLKQTEGFSPEAFEANVSSVSEDLKQYIEKLKLDGTLKTCIEKTETASLDSVSDESVAQAKEHIARFSAECQAWDELLQHYQKGAEEMARQLEECKANQGHAEPPNYMETSQAEVLSSKPNYQAVLDAQGEGLKCMELVLDELRQAVELLRAFGEDSRRYLQGLSQHLAARTFRRLQDSPVRKLLAAPRRPAPPEG